MRACVSNYPLSPSLSVNIGTRRVSFSMGHAGASRESPNGAPWETLSQRLCRPISEKPRHRSGYERRRSKHE